ncbi:MIP/aquaporin family protein [Deinococcus deserti]|uniref:Putative glycerol uptake facilitator protein, putative aquaporin putative membrane protein n=1 Tax=Deinococcus deserti (strain DSM 17065 / CIP 109153 / LMG 22923 / VCD115) TaxID=546414 RepID=C1D2N9_DEIDV|nr:MIP/aquaporin family protein [Deinococcus deserti]ACO47678.1 putative glycerol uptake facilitator protein, putative aquaporin; putative membrane protein [Deinococcus deserti VCD115]
MTFTKAQEFMAELLGTMVLILFGCGVVAMVVLFASNNPAIPGQIVNGGYTNITLGWGFAVLMGIFIAGTISGAHLNPAVTIALAATGRFPWSKVAHYIAGQFVGAFLGAALVFAVYHAKWLGVDPSLANTAGIFSTFPAVPGFWPGFIDQVVGTALLMGLILAIGDKLNNPAGAAWGPLAVAFVVMAIGISFGGMHGYAINPARDLGPRLFALIAGFQNTGFQNGVWLIPVIGPLVGGLLGALIYDTFIGKPLLRAGATAHGVQGADPAYNLEHQS